MTGRTASRCLRSVAEVPRQRSDGITALRRRTCEGADEELARGGERRDWRIGRRRRRIAEWRLSLLHALEHRIERRKIGTDIRAVVWHRALEDAAVPNGVVAVRAVYVLCFEGLWHQGNR